MLELALTLRLFVLNVFGVPVTGVINGGVLLVVKLVQEQSILMLLVVIVITVGAVVMGTTRVDCVTIPVVSD